MTSEQAEASFARTRELLGVPIEVLYCPHGGGPPVCWCRKPLPGLGVVFIQLHQLDPAQCVYVGAGPQDPVLRAASAFSIATRWISSQRRREDKSIDDFDDL